MKNLRDVLNEDRNLYRQEELILECTELIAKVMHDSGISKAQLASRMGKSKAFITQCLSGRQNLTLRTLADFFTALHYQLQVGAVPSEANRGLRSIPRLYPVAAWKFEQPASGEPLVIDCAAGAWSDEVLQNEEPMCAA